MIRPTLLILLSLVSTATAVGAPVDTPALEKAWKSLSTAAPRTVEQCIRADTKNLAAAAEQFEARAAEHLTAASRRLEQQQESSSAFPRLRARMRRAPRAAASSSRRPLNATLVTSSLEPLLLAKQRVDELLDELLEIRGGFAQVSPDDKQRAALRNYLRSMAALIDLSGRLRYLQFDAVNVATTIAESDAAECERLVSLLTDYRSTIGATVMVELLFDPEGESRETELLKASDSLKLKILHLIAVSEQSDLLPELADYVLDAPATPALVIQAAETIRVLGLPQDPRPVHDPSLPPVAITAIELRQKLQSLNPKSLGTTLDARRQALLAWLDRRIERGITDGKYELGHGQFAPGDWLLMRNPSPYNLFTDISPGLFTHVGVVAEEIDKMGVTRIVLVDLPERGTRMPATTVDTFVKRTRHYVVLRHEDADVARKMGQAAADMIGNETQFDLNFRTRRVLDYAGKPLKGQKIHTYCAGLLLLCALQSGHPREEFFPIAEYPAPGKTQNNLKTFGMSIGEDFISPTGALFSSKFKIVARREPMYDPRREVEEAIYDHFAARMITADIRPATDAFKSLRLKVAEASKTNPLLAQALASAANVSAETDLVAAAQAAAVVETLDEVAKGTSAEFLAAQQAMRAGTAQQMAADGLKPEEMERLKKLRDRHANLYGRWTARQVSPRSMRIELVNYYVAQGSQRIDSRFFNSALPQK